MLLDVLGQYRHLKQFPNVCYTIVNNNDNDNNNNKNNNHNNNALIEQLYLVWGPKHYIGIPFWQPAT